MNHSDDDDLSEFDVCLFCPDLNRRNASGLHLSRWMR